MIQDVNGNEITISSYVRYVNTGTKGHVVDIKTDENSVWVVLDNDLMYKPYLLEILEEEEKEKREVLDKDELIKKLMKEGKIEISNDIDACGT
ncbi:DUF2098 domain-containing protein [Methanotorris formicicus]|uniref:DUF2098 domain-containing protein n=1 Tax=Methanotorris formicicus Mc-S-70 TaxID=647171 RepID=H1KZT1_9EURY|nr:DUF2098 family protein [Methanotorris formicicus]EHP85628.1 Protein of unknown function DUF2098 [Methanotorris formicicus Mc-S-70]